MNDILRTMVLENSSSSETVGHFLYLSRGILRPRIIMLKVAHLYDPVLCCRLVSAGELIDTLSYLFRQVLRHLYIKEETADHTPSVRDL
jgi:hypothetical protein